MGPALFNGFHSTDFLNSSLVQLHVEVVGHGKEQRRFPWCGRAGHPKHVCALGTYKDTPCHAHCSGPPPAHVWRSTSREGPLPLTSRPAAPTIRVAPAPTHPRCHAKSLQTCATRSRPAPSPPHLPIQLQLTLTRSRQHPPPRVPGLPSNHAKLAPPRPLLRLGVGPHTA